MMKRLQRMMFRVLPDCREAEQLQSRRLDERLSLGNRALLWMHCLICSCCRRFGFQLELVHDFCEKLPEHGEELAEETPMPEEAKERVRDRIAEETRS